MKMKILALCALMLVIMGCETIKGIGKDVTTVGRWLTGGAEKVQSPQAKK